MQMGKSTKRIYKGGGKGVCNIMVKMIPPVNDHQRLCKRGEGGKGGRGGYITRDKIQERIIIYSSPPPKKKKKKKRKADG